MSEIAVEIIDQNEKEKKQLKRFYWKGKKVSEQVDKQRLKQQALAQNIWKNKNNVQEKPKQPEPNLLEGRRIMHIETLAKEMICKNCKSKLHFSDITYEKRYGLASIFFITCDKCKIISTVASDKQHKTTSNITHFDTNTKAVIGTLNAGIGATHLNKLLAAWNMPTLNWKTFKDHEKEVGVCIEEMSWESCKQATLQEKRLMIENLDTVEKLLPPHLKLIFIFPTLPEDFDFKNADVNFLMTLTVRLFILFDFGWTTKGSGRSYDSLCGTGSFIGYFTKKVVMYINLNRKCKSCDNNVPLDQHICRKNFKGSAKSMEPYAASQLINNQVFKECLVEVGGVGADNDSCAIKAMREACDHEIFKYSDKNHTSKGVVSELHRIKSYHKELNNKEITYLQKCYNYCVAQCKDNSTVMANALNNIPYHCYNIHDTCGDWCRYIKNPDNYKHSVIGEGFTDPKLLEDLKCLFGALSKKSSELCKLISTNPNESLNNVIASFAPKSRMYGMSASGSQRTACAINKKNNGQKYCVDLNGNLTLSPGRHTLRHAQKVDAFTKRRYEKQSTVEAKRHRLENKKLRSQLKYTREMSEGTTYESNIGLLNDFNVQHIPVKVCDIDKNTPYIVVLFDLETSGFGKEADILQIAAKYEQFEFSAYINHFPKKNISAEASLVHKLTYVNNNLQYKHKNVIAFSLRDVMIAFYTFLCSLNKKCILTAHNCSFDSFKLIRVTKLVSIEENFKSIVVGFSDTLSILKKLVVEKARMQILLKPLHVLKKLKFLKLTTL